MKHYCYKIINKVNGHYYIGRRSYVGEILEEDNYFGSGKRLKTAIKKYGIDNFEKHILLECNTLEELVAAEKSLVTSVEVKDAKCYNIALGGHGGYTDYSNRVYTHTEYHKLKISKANTGRKRPGAGDHLKQFWIGKSRSEEDKLKKSAAAQKKITEGRSTLHETVTCPHCHISTNFGNAKRWHFDNCRNN